MAYISLSLRAGQLGKDLADVSQETLAAAQVAVSQVAIAARYKLETLASQKLKSTRSLYVGAIRLDTIGDNVYEIYLEGEAANLIESGYPGFDIKAKMLASPKAKWTIDKKGKYIDIPFRIQPFSEAPTYDRSASIRSAAMNLIKNRGLDTTITNEDGNPIEGVVARINDAPMKELAGLMKVQKVFEPTTAAGNLKQAVQRQYYTVRRISSNSPDTSWMHPGFTGAQLFPEIENFVNQQFDDILNSLIP